MTYYKYQIGTKSRAKYGPRFKADDVRSFREWHHCGMMEAKKILMREQILQDLHKGRDSSDIELVYDILEYMMGNDYV